MKAIRLTSAGLLTAILCFSYLYFFEYGRLYVAYRCWKQAWSVTSCFRDRDFDFTADLFGMRYEGNTANWVDSQIYYYGAYEKPILFFLKDVMKSAYSNQGIFLDIGANTGQYSLFMSRYAKEIHAFEPYEPVLKRFRRLVEINHIRNVVIHPVGLGNENLKKPFYKPPDANAVTGSFVEGFKPENTLGRELEIQIGDDALEKAGVTSVALIKMDIEGYEKPALQGLRRALQKSRPVTVFELSVDPKGPVSIKSKDDLRSLFPQNYDFLVFDKASNPLTGSYVLKAMDEKVRFDTPEQYDVIAYPTEKRSNFSRRGPSS